MQLAETPTHRVGSRVGGVVFAAALFSVLLLPGRAHGAPTPPVASTSYYEKVIAGSTNGLARRMYQQGYRAGASGIVKQVVFLEFGAPRAVGATYGQAVFGSAHVDLSFDTILSYLKQFSNGYHDGWQTPNSGSITIAWGTSNGRIPISWSDATATAAAQAWEADVAALQQYKNQHLFNRQHVAAADDIEQNVSEKWNDYPVTKAFVDAYRSISGAPVLINNGDDDFGALNTTNPPTYGSWTAGGIVYLSRGPNNNTLACPQVYSKPFADRWAQTEYFADQNGSPLVFFCTLWSNKVSTDFETAGTLGGDAGVAWGYFYDDLANDSGSNYVAPGHDYLGPRASFIQALGG